MATDNVAPIEQLASTAVIDSSSEAVLAADAVYTEAKSLRGKDPEQAVRLFSDALKMRVEIYGEKAPEVAETYLEYGLALYNQAISTAEWYGEKACKQRETVRLPGTQAGGSSVAADTTPEVAVLPKGKPDAEESEGVDEDEEECSENDGVGESSGGNSDDEGSGGGEVGDEDDMTLAWQALELARVIYEKHGGALKHPSALADAYITLGDIDCEQEHFDNGVCEYKRGLEALCYLPVMDPRRMAEAHFKLTLALQFNDQLQPALESCRTAIEQVQLARSGIDEAADAALSPAEAAAAAAAAVAAVGPSSGVTPAEAAAAARLATEAAVARADEDMEVLHTVLEELRNKEEELQQLIREEVSMGAVLRGVLQTATGVAGSAAGPGNGIASTAPLAMAPSAPFGAPSSRTAGAPVQDLGTAGRGRNRITLQPTAAVGKGSAGAPLAAGPSPAPKRSLADLMGAADGVTTIGFGAAPASAFSVPAKAAVASVAPFSCRAPLAPSNPVAPFAATTLPNLSAKRQKPDAADMAPAPTNKGL